MKTANPSDLSNPSFQRLLKRKLPLLTSLVAGGAMLAFTGCRDRNDDRYVQTDTTIEAREDTALAPATYPTADRTRDSFAQTEARPADESSQIVLHEENLDVTTREVDAGAVVVTKDVVTEEVEQPVELRRERVEVAHLSPEEADARVQEGAAFQEDEIVIPLTREEAVVQKDVEAREVLDIQKETDIERQQVGGTVRREVADVERQPAETSAEADQFAVASSGEEPAATSESYASTAAPAAGLGDLEQRIREDLRSAQEVALSDEEIDQLDITVEDNAVVIAGTVPNEQVARQIELRVSQMNDVENVENQLRAADAGAVAE